MRKINGKKSYVSEARYIVYIDIPVSVRYRYNKSWSYRTPSQHPLFDISSTIICCWGSIFLFLDTMMPV